MSYDMFKIILLNIFLLNVFLITYKFLPRYAKLLLFNRIRARLIIQLNEMISRKNFIEKIFYRNYCRRSYYFCYLLLIVRMKCGVFHRASRNRIIHHWRIQETAITNMEFVISNCRLIAPFVPLQPFLSFFLLSWYVFWSHEATPINPFPLFGKHRADLLMTDDRAEID